MDARISAVFREFRALMYSDEGEFHGVPAYEIWQLLKDEYADWLVLPD